MRYTKIPWCDETWNPVVGCFPQGPGCEHCYAAMMAARFSKGYYRGLARMEDGEGRWTNRVKFFPKKLLEPWSRKSGKKFFVCSMGDLFHDQVPPDWMDHAFAVMAGVPRHTFQVLTKRPRAMAGYLSDPATPGNVWEVLEELLPGHSYHAANLDRFREDRAMRWPLRNVWCGVSAEDQDRYDDRIGALLKTPARIRFVSLEPLLGPIDLKLDYLPGKVDWVIVGEESGQGRRRAMDEGWVKSIRNQARKAGAAFFYKQRRLNITTMEETPELDGRRWVEFPEVK